MQKFSFCISASVKLCYPVNSDVFETCNISLLCLCAITYHSTHNASMCVVEVSRISDFWVSNRKKRDDKHCSSRMGVICHLIHYTVSSLLCVLHIF